MLRSTDDGKVFLRDGRCLARLMRRQRRRAVAPPITVTASSEFNTNFAVTNLFDATVTNADVGITLYGNPDGQWAGVGADPFNVFMDFGSTLIDMDGLAYSQRLGGNPALDKVGRIDLWFSNSDFGGVIPVHAGQRQHTHHEHHDHGIDSVFIRRTMNSTADMSLRGSSPRLAAVEISAAANSVCRRTRLGHLLPELTVNRDYRKVSRLSNDTSSRHLHCL